MPNGAYSVASVLASPATAARRELESNSPSTGCLTADEVMVIRRPHPFCCIRGSTSLEKYTVLKSNCSAAAFHSPADVSRKGLDGGPPELVTQISMRPKRSSTADRKSTRLNSSHVKISYA